MYLIHQAWKFEVSMRDKILKKLKHTTVSYKFKSILTYSKYYSSFFDSCDFYSIEQHLLHEWDRLYS